MLFIIYSPPLERIEFLGNPLREAPTQYKIYEYHLLYNSIS